MWHVSDVQAGRGLKPVGRPARPCMKGKPAAVSGRGSSEIVAAVAVATHPSDPVVPAAAPGTAGGGEGEGDREEEAPEAAAIVTAAPAAAPVAVPAGALPGSSAVAACDAAAAAAAPLASAAAAFPGLRSPLRGQGPHLTCFPGCLRVVS